MFSDGDWEDDHFRKGFFASRSILVNATFNETEDNSTGNVFAWTNQHSITYIIVPLLCVFLCALATVINARILLCVKWIRRPLSPTLYISLSLALADTCSAVLIFPCTRDIFGNQRDFHVPENNIAGDHKQPTDFKFFKQREDLLLPLLNYWNVDMWIGSYDRKGRRRPPLNVWNQYEKIGLGFVFNSLLPKGLNVNVDNDCLFLILEAFRLSGILISTIHLLVLAGNHYFGILCPFRSMRWMTHTNLTIVVVFIWIAPTAYIFAYFGSFKNQGFQREDCQIEESKNFLSFSRFRTIFSTLFFIPLILMLAIYIHISIIVRKHQASRRWFNRHSRRHNNTGSRSDQQKQFDRNLKAIWTSLLILSTYVICFMPAVLHFYLICNDCYFEFESVGTWNLILTSSITNFLLITKYLLNPLIYASRMQEIRMATRQMNAECRRKLCNYASSDDALREVSFNEGTQRFSVHSGSSRRNNIGLNSIHLKNGYCKATKKLKATNL